MSKYKDYYINVETLYKLCKNNIDNSITPNDFMRIPMRVIVNCEDCKYGEKTKNGFKEYVIECHNSDLGMMGDCHSPYWYCGDGERK